MSDPTKTTYLPGRRVPNMNAFHLDECMDGQVSPVLRRKGFDVTTTAERGLAGTSDNQQLAFATHQRRILITRDKDFLKLHRNSRRHAGIVFCPAGRLSATRLARFLANMQDDTSYEENIALRDIFNAFVNGILLGGVIMAGLFLTLVLFS